MLKRIYIYIYTYSSVCVCMCVCVCVCVCPCISIMCYIISVQKSEKETFMKCSFSWMEGLEQVNYLQTYIHSYTYLIYVYACILLVHLVCIVYF